MNILIINAGSSSIKSQLIRMPSEEVPCSGTVERIGAPDAILKYKNGSVDIEEVGTIADHREGFRKIVSFLLHPEKGAVKDVAEIDAIGHRVVHGGDSFHETTLITASVKQEIGDYAALAPLHNPHNLEGIYIAEELFPKAKQIAIFDTAFHRTIPEKARKYAIPDSFYTEQGIQVYGFHGISHKYVYGKAVAYLDNQKAKIITIHLGNGCSMTAVAAGKSRDHSMGFGPNEGLIMGSRSGDIDPSVIFHLINTLGYDPREIDNLLTKKSGMLGLTGYTDLRDIQKEAEKENAACQLALEMNAYRIKKYIGAYAAALNGLDAIVFTAGIGENSSVLRKMVCADMDYLGITLDDAKNEGQSNALREIGYAAAKVKILVVPTNEELEIAKQVFGLLVR